METRKCSKCKEPLPITKFRLKSSNGRKNPQPYKFYSSWCVDCQRERCTEAARADPEGHRSRTASWRASHPEANLWSAAKKRAKDRGVEFTISVSDIIIPEICPVLGVRMAPAPAGTGHGLPTSPSLDRIDARRGYVPGNVQVISRKANAMKQDATLEEMVLLGEWARSKLEG